jgi:putative transposase
MRYPASEKLEIIRLVEESALPVRRTLERIGIPHATFYRSCRQGRPKDRSTSSSNPMMVRP